MSLPLPEQYREEIQGIDAEQGQRRRGREGRFVEGGKEAYRAGLFGQKLR